MLRTASLLLLSSALFACESEPDSLGVEPLYARCEVPPVAMEAAPLAECGPPLGDAARVYPTALEDRLVSCKLRYPSDPSLDSAEQAKLKCPAGPLRVLTRAGHVLVLESQVATDSSGVFVHEFDLLPGASGYAYASTRFIESSLGAKVAQNPYVHYVSGETFVFVGPEGIVRFDGNVFSASTPRLVPDTGTHFALARGPGANTTGDYVSATASAEAISVRRYASDGALLTEWKDDSLGHLPIRGLAENEAGEVALLVGSILPGLRLATYLVVLEPTGEERFRTRIATLTEYAAVRFEASRIVIVGTTNVSFTTDADGGHELVETRESDSELIATYDLTSGCPLSLTSTGLHVEAPGRLWRPLVASGAAPGTYVYGYDSGARNTFPEVVTSDATGRTCDTIELVDDGNEDTSSLTEIVELASGGFAATDGSDVWFVLPAE